MSRPSPSAANFFPCTCILDRQVRVKKDPRVATVSRLLAFRTFTLYTNAHACRFREEQLVVRKKLSMISSSVS